MYMYIPCVIQLHVHVHVLTYNVQIVHDDDMAQ